MKNVFAFLLLPPTLAFCQATNGFHSEGQVDSRSPHGLALQAVPNTAVGVAAAATQSTATIHSDPLLSSFNSQISVMAYGAKGDCVTDDRASIQAAFTASHGQQPWKPVSFPIPPGGCFLTSTLSWMGETLLGQEPSGVVPALQSAGVVIKGMPGQDILHRPDPNTTSSAHKASWSITGIAFEVDDSVDASASNVHRWPGRFSSDGAMTSGSKLLTTANAEVSCSDQGQNIEVFGAGPSGGNLVTTISNVAPCWQNGMSQAITLAASASTTVTGAVVYITPANISVTQHIGNCAIAMDNFDGNTANWLSVAGNNADLLDHVSLMSVSGGQQNNSCGLYMQSSNQAYNMTVRNFYFSRLVWTVVYGVGDTNISSSGYTSGQDYQKWDHGYLGGQYPWITYNGNDYALEDIEMAGTNGIQVLQVKTAVEYSTGNWYLRIPEMEQVTGVGDRIVGLATSDMTSLCGGLGTYAFLDTSGSSFRNATCPFGTLVVYGQNNSVTLAGFWSNTPLDKGEQDTIIGSYSANPYKSREPTVKLALTPTRGLDYVSGIMNADFIANGNASSPYPNRNDLFIWPEDMYAEPHLTFGYDSTSLTTRYASSAVPSTIGVFFHLGGWNTANHGIVLGRDIPATSAILYLSIKCSVSNSANVYFNIGGANYATTAFTCGTSYRTVAVTQTGLSVHAGSGIGLEVHPTAGTYQIAWAAFRPFQGDYNGQQPVLSLTALNTTGSGAAVPTGPMSSTPHDCIWFIDTMGTLADSGRGCGGGPLSSIVLNTSDNTDSGGLLSLSSATTASFSFTKGAASGAYTNIPICTWTPRFNNGNVAYWDTSSVSRAQITFSSAVTGSVNYICVVRNN